MRFREILARSMFAVALASPAVLQSAEPLNAGLVETAGHGLFVAPPMEASLVVTNVRVFNDDNELVLSERTLVDSVQLLAADLPDGKYTYEVVSVFELAEPTGTGADREEFSSQRHFGSFEVQAGAIVPRGPEPSRAQSDRDDLSMLDHASSRAMAAAGWVLSLLVSEAQAQDVTIIDATPEIWFDDADVASCCEWRILGEGTTSAGSFSLTDFVGSNNHPVFTINSAAGSVLNQNSIVVDADGDIHWANSAMNFDRSAETLSIGTTNNSSEIVISATTPDFRMIDETAGEQFEIQMTNRVEFWTDPTEGGFRIVMELDNNAPADSLVIDELGNALFGSKIHVGAQNDPVGQFTITSPDQPRFEMNDTTLGKRWRFSVASDKFAINNLDVAGTEFQVFDNGDVLITGALTQNSDRNAKQDIVPVDQHSVLERIASLPIAEWSYKDAPQQRHIGPMAQDFYAAFGLGMNDTGITTLDTSGVALAGIQALAADNAAIRAQNEALLELNAELSERLTALEQQQARTQAIMARVLEAQLAQPVLTRTLAN